MMSFRNKDKKIKILHKDVKMLRIHTKSVKHKTSM